MTSQYHGRELTCMVVDELAYMKHQRKLVWQRAEKPLTLAARLSANGWDVGIYDNDMDPVQAWCEEHHCGKRVSFDQFRFRNKREVTMFLLRWA